VYSRRIQKSCATVVAGQAGSVQFFLTGVSVIEHAHRRNELLIEHSKKLQATNWLASKQLFSIQLKRV